MFRRLASLTALASFWTSTTKRAEGRRLMSRMDPRFFSSFARWRSTWRRSLLASFSNVPSSFILSMVFIFLTALRMVGKLVSIPPGQRSVTDGMLTAAAFSATTSLACFLVATKRTLRPLRAISLSTSAASSIFTTDLCRSMMWIPFFWSKMYGAILGFHLRARCPKCAPASSSSWKLVLDIMSFDSFLFFSFFNPE